MNRPNSVADGTTSISLLLMITGSNSTFVVEKLMGSSLHLDSFRCIPSFLDFAANSLTDKFALH